MTHSTYNIPSPNMQKWLPQKDTYLKRDKKQVSFTFKYARYNFITLQVVIKTNIKLTTKSAPFRRVLLKYTTS